MEIKTKKKITYGVIGIAKRKLDYFPLCVAPNEQQHLSSGRQWYKES